MLARLSRPTRRILLTRTCATPPSSTVPPIPSTSVDPSEIQKFTALASEWWDPRGTSAPLHRMNPTRISFIRSALERRMASLPPPSPSSPSSPSTPTQSPLPLARARILDIGCGGGLACEPLARLGATVLGADMSEACVGTARAHAALDPSLGPRLSYSQVSAESLVASGSSFDAVLALEVIEHVSEPGQFLRDCAALVRPGGLLVVSTLNRTAASYALGIIAAERILRWLPEGTHEWTRFVAPAEVRDAVEEEGLVGDEVTGVSFDPLRNRFYLSEDLSVNYILTAYKPLVPAEGD